MDDKPGIRAMTILKTNFQFSALFVALLALPGCAVPGKLQQAFSRNASDDIGQTRVARKDKLAQDFDRQRDDAQFEAAASSWERGDVEGCRKILEQLLERNPNHRRARLLLADLYLFNGQTDRSAAELNKALIADPKDAMAHHSLAQVLDACGQRDEAMAQYKMAAQLDPNNQVYAQSYQMALDLVPTAAPRELLAATNTKFDELKKSSVADDPIHTDHRIQLASAVQPPAAGQQIQGSLEGVAKGSSPTRVFASDDINNWVMPIDTQLPSGQIDRSNDLSTQPAATPSAIAASATPSASRVQLASWNAPDGKSLRPVEPTVKLASRPEPSAGSAAAGTNPQIRQSPLRESVVALAQGDTEAAIAAAQRGLAEPSAQPAALYRVMGAAHYRRGEFHTAQGELAQALSLDNTDALSYFLMSATLEKLNEHEAAAGFRAEAARLDARFSQ
jgi:tetratricopeptide (TPR) repeat protein